MEGEKTDMLIRKGVFLAVLLIAGLLPVPAMGEDNPAQEEAPYFSNEDIEQYKMPSDNKSRDARATKTDDREEKAREKKEQLDRENWCKRANLLKRKIEKAQDEISEAKKELSEENMSRRKVPALRKKLGKAEKQKEYAERDLSDLEEEAHRKDVPPGWLRCQFE